MMALLSKHLLETIDAAVAAPARSRTCRPRSISLILARDGEGRRGPRPRRWRCSASRSPSCWRSSRSTRCRARRSGPRARHGGRACLAAGVAARRRTRRTPPAYSAMPAAPPTYATHGPQMPAPAFAPADLRLAAAPPPVRAGGTSRPERRRRRSRRSRAAAAPVSPLRLRTRIRRRRRDHRRDTRRTPVAVRAGLRRQPGLPVRSSARGSDDASGTAAGTTRRASAAGHAGLRRLHPATVGRAVLQPPRGRDATDRPRRRCNERRRQQQGDVDRARVLVLAGGGVGIVMAMRRSATRTSDPQAENGSGSDSDSETESDTGSGSGSGSGSSSGCTLTAGSDDPWAGGGATAISHDAVTDRRRPADTDVDARTDAAGDSRVLGQCETLVQGASRHRRPSRSTIVAGGAAAGAARQTHRRARRIRVERSRPAYGPGCSTVRHDAPSSAMYARRKHARRHVSHPPHPVSRAAVVEPPSFGSAS